MILILICTYILTFTATLISTVAIIKIQFNMIDSEKYVKGKIIQNLRCMIDDQ